MNVYRHKLLDLMNDGLVEPSTMAEILISWLSEADCRDLYEQEFEDELGDEEEVEEEDEEEDEEDEDEEESP